MRAWLVALAACSGGPIPTPKPPAPVEPTGPELWTSAPGATELGVLGDEVLWFAPVDGGSDEDLDTNGIFRHPGGVRLDSPRLAHVAVGARALSVTSNDLVWSEGSGVERIGLGTIVTRDRDYHEVSRGRLIGDPRVVARVDGTVASIAEQGRWLAIAVDAPAGAELVRQKLDGAATSGSLDGANPIVAAGSDAFDVGTSTTLYRIDNTGVLDLVLVDGGVRALAVDGDDVFAGGTIIYERAGRGRLVKLGPAGGAVTAMAVDAKYVYWATAAGDREPAIYRALRSKPERELFTQVGAAAALAIAGEYLYWLDPIEGAIHRIRR